MISFVFKWGAILEVLIFTCFALYVGSRVISGYSNHVGLDFSVFIPVLLSFFVLGCVGCFKRLGGYYSWVIVVVSLIFLIAIYLLDVTAILVHYEEWLDRGMPESPI